MNYVFRTAAVERHVERVKHELCAQMIGHRPTDDTAAVHIQHDSEKQKAAPRRDVGDIRNPELVRSAGCEVAINQVRRWPRITISDGCFEAFSPCGAVEFPLTHDASDALVAYAKAFIEKVLPESRPAVGGTRFSVQHLEAIAERDIGLPTQGWRPFEPCIIAARRYVEHFADSRCFERRLVRLHEFESLFGIESLSRANQAAVFLGSPAQSPTREHAF